jgi:hypothetical protein
MNVVGLVGDAEGVRLGVSEGVEVAGEREGVLLGFLDGFDVIGDDEGPVEGAPVPGESVAQFWTTILRKVKYISLKGADILFTGGSSPHASL